MSTTSQRLSQVKPSPTLAISARAGEMRAQGINVIPLSVGEPDFDTPEHIKQAAIDAIHAGHTKYTAVDGLPALKEAVIGKFQRDNNLKYEPNQIVVSTGAKQSLFNILLALLNPGDEVIIPAPYWVSYPAMAMIAEAKPVVVDTSISDKFKMQPEQLEAAITPKSRLLFLNSPSNPSGMAYSKDELAALGEVLLKHPNIIVVSDDIYEHVMWEGKEFVSILNACPELYDRTIVVNGLSKAFAMTGWRLGYAAGPKEILQACKKIQSQSTSNPCTITQYAGIAALNGDMSGIKDMVKVFKTRHDFVVSGLNAIDGFDCLEGDGTFYAFPNVKPVIERLGMKNDIEFAEYLLNEAKVASVPGSAFGMNGYIRLSFALDEKNLKNALQSIDQAVSAK